MPRISCHVDLALLKENFAVLKQCAGSCRMMPVLKYNAYGMGANAIAPALKSAGAYRFAVATLDEALALDPAGLEIQILGVLTDGEIPDAVAAGFILPVCDIEVARKISAECVRQQRQARIAVKLDTGMGRLGFVPETSVAAIMETAALPGLTADGLFAHFSMAARPDMDYCRWQIARFRNCAAALQAAGVTFPHLHHAASDGILNVPESVSPPFNLARPGGAMYGSDFESRCKQIIRLTTTIGSVRQIKAGTSIGYWRTFTADRSKLAAVIPAGYADGLPLALSNRGHVLVRGTLCPVLGRVSMDYTVIDVSHLPDIQIGEEVVLLGRQGDKAITVAGWGELKSTHSHDIWCAIGNRVRRTYSG